MELKEYKRDLEQYGKTVYQSNPDFQMIAEFMEHPLSRQFYNEFLKRGSLESTLFFLWLYSQIEECYPGIQPYEKLGMVSICMKNKKLRDHIYQCYTQKKPVQLQKTIEF